MSLAFKTSGFRVAQRVAQLEVECLGEVAVRIQAAGTILKFETLNTETPYST